MKKDVSMCMGSESLMVCSAGKAMAFTPALTASMSVSVLCFPLGLMQPSIKDHSSGLFCSKPSLHVF